MSFIFGNSIKKSEESKNQSDKVVEIVRPIIDPDHLMSDDQISHVVRKSAHFVEFFALGALCALLAYHIRYRLTLSGAACSALWCLLSANIDEYIQSLNDRGSLVSDVLLDFSGAISGIIIGSVLAFVIKIAVKKIKKEN